MQNRLYVQMSHAGRVVKIFDHFPTLLERDLAYSEYLEKEYQYSISMFNTWVELWELNGKKLKNDFLDLSDEEYQN